MQSYRENTLEKNDMDSLLPGSVTEDALQNAKYQFVASAVITMRSAITAGAGESAARDICKSYLEQIESVPSVDEIHVLFDTMHSEFVKLIETRIESQLIRRCLKYVGEHLDERLKVSDVAQKLGVNTCHLSSTFKREVGTSLSTYITEQKINIAKNMLVSSNTSSAEIARNLAFSSQSYFIQTFKRLTGLTPAKYRTYAQKI